MKTKKKLLAMFLALCMIGTVFAALPTTAFAAEQKCGDNLYWSLNTSTGVLEITGSGKMYDYTAYSNAPWYSNRGYITTVNIGSDVISIGNYAFYSCFFIPSVSIPKSVKTIGDSAFAACSSLQSVTIPDSVTSIGEWAFGGCSLTSVTIPNSVTTIGEYTFFNCSSLQSVTIPNGVTSIGEWAFSYCSSLTSVTIPDSVTSIGSEAFSGTGYYNNASNWENDVLYIGKHLIKAKGTLSGAYTIKDEIRHIADSAFFSCHGVTAVTIPESMVSIGNSAFEGCDGISDVYYSGTEEDWNKISIGSGNNPLKNATKHFLEYDIALDKVQSVQTNKGENATIRFFFTPEYNKGEAENYGAYIIPMWVFDQGGAEDAALIKKNESIESGVQYSADLKLIPKDCFDDDILAMPFITIGGKTRIIIDTDAYNSNTVNNTDIHQ